MSVFCQLKVGEPIAFRTAFIDAANWTNSLLKTNFVEGDVFLTWIVPALIILKFKIKNSLFSLYTKLNTNTRKIPNGVWTLCNYH